MQGEWCDFGDHPKEGWEGRSKKITQVVKEKKNIQQLKRVDQAIKHVQVSYAFKIAQIFAKVD